ncbi:hypothetical protein JOM56_001602 [Amanita muscaria]
MFGESESESPRVPSPWDNLISSSPASSAHSSSHPSPHLNPTYLGPVPNPSQSLQQAVMQTELPRLAPEDDSGNVEYKLQLLSPSPARFARLVTQLKWRLLEGGGQAYYELGVADSGDLIGLSRTEMEATLETLEMMAGELGASVVVVKEIEVPETTMKAVTAQQDLTWIAEKKWGKKKRRRNVVEATTTTHVVLATPSETTDTEEESEDLSATVTLSRPVSDATTTDTEEDLSATVMLSRPVMDATTSESASVFTMDLEPEPETVEIVISMDKRVTELSKGEMEDGKRIIVEALVVRKMSLEEAFLDFGGAFAN